MASRRILIEAGAVTMEAELDATSTAGQIWEALPIEGRGTRWGDEIYFEIPVVAQQAQEARAQMEVGELGYWPMGRAFCIFFGRTPVSEDERPKAYSPVNVVGRLLGDASQFSGVEDGASIRLSRVAGEH